MPWLLAVLASLAWGLMLAFALGRRGPPGEARAHWWRLLHHAVVILLAAATALALALPADLLGGRRQSGLWGGYLGHVGVLAFFVTLLLVALTLLLRALLRRLQSRASRAVVVATVWALTVLLGSFVAIAVVT